MSGKFCCVGGWLVVSGWSVGGWLVVGLPVFSYCAGCLYLVGVVVVLVVWLCLFNIVIALFVCLQLVCFLVASDDVLRTENGSVRTDLC